MSRPAASCFPPSNAFETHCFFCDGIMPPVRFTGQRKTYARLRAFRSIVSSVQEGLMKVLSLLFAFALLAGAQETLTNDSIVKMVKGGLSDDVIVTVIQKQPGK